MRKQKIKTGMISLKPNKRMPTYVEESMKNKKIVFYCPQCKKKFKTLKHFQKSSCFLEIKDENELSVALNWTIKYFDCKPINSFGSYRIDVLKALGFKPSVKISIPKHFIDAFKIYHRKVLYS